MTKRAVMLVSALLLVLGMVACGDDAGETAVTTGPTTAGSTSDAETTSTAESTDTTMPPEVADALEAMGQLAATADAVIEAEALLATYEADVEAFGSDLTFTGAEAAELLGTGVGDRSFTFGEVADIVQALGTAELTGEEIGTAVQALGPDQAAAIPVDHIGDLFGDLGLGDPDTVLDLLGRLHIGFGHLPGSEEPATVDAAGLGALLSEATGGGTFSAIDLASIIRTIPGGGGEICCTAIPVGDLLDQVAPGESIGYPALESLGAGLVGLDTFQSRIFGRIGWADICCNERPQQIQAATEQVVSSLPALEAAVSFAASAEVGEAVEALGQACTSIETSAAALGVDTATRAVAEADLAEARATIDLFWLDYDRLNALLEAIANGGFPPPVEDCDEYLEAAFPMTAHLRSNRLPGQEGKAWHMETWVTVFDTGQLDGKTRIWSSEALRGFHGGVTVLAKDEDGRVVAASPMHKWGVCSTTEDWVGTCPADRTITWAGEHLYDINTGEVLTAEQLCEVRSLEIIHMYTPNDVWAELLEKAGDVIGLVCPNGIESIDIAGDAVKIKCND